MFEYCETFEYAIKLWAVADIFSSLMEATRSGDIKAIDSQLTLRWIDLASQAFEKCGFACAWNSKKCEAFTELQTKRNLLNSSYIAISLA